MHQTLHQIKTICSDKLNPFVMGILNVTPDSFFDGNQYIDLSKAIERAMSMIEQGASILDIGGESTRPGAQEVSIHEEMERVIPVIKSIRELTDIPISIDTRNAELADRAIKCGANIINDVSALRHDVGMIKVLKQYPQTGIILMHMQGTPEIMQQNPEYMNVIEDINAFFGERIDFCKANGIDESRIYLDPGIGFGKTLKHNLIILSHLKEFKKFGLPIVLGASRKRFIGEIYPAIPSERLGGSLAATQLAKEAGIEIIRVHDVQQHVQFISVLDAVFAVKDK